MSLRIFNTLSRTKEPFETLDPGLVRLYVCGVTVYDSAHVGHAMSYLVFDAVRRYLEFRGYEVRHVQNFTDIDDKTIKRADEEGTSVFEVADRYAREFFIETDKLGVLPARVYPRVSSEMPQIVEMIGRLIQLGNAYATEEGDVYFSVRSFADYGRLSRRDLDAAEPQEGAAGNKRDEHDFALWKHAREGEPAWESPWGPGRPGWHIECSAMAEHHLGPRIDIHGGGSDLIFPHHENEIAQSEAACKCSPFARYWMHNGLVQIEGEKMSKSLGNIVSIREFLTVHEPEALRLFVQSSHYRRPNTLTDESIAAAERGLARLRGGMRPAHARASGAAAEGGDAKRLDEATAAARERFVSEMDDDFGTPGALAALFELVTEINRAREAGVGGAVFDTARATLSELAGVLGFRLREFGSDDGAGADAAEFIELLVTLRDEARARKDWAMSDRLRDELASRGVAVEDRPDGAVWRLT